MTQQNDSRPDLVVSTSPMPTDSDLLTPESLRYWTAEYGRSALTETNQADTELVLFRLGDERFAVPIGDLDQVACITGGIAVAHASPVLLGLANLRGEVLPLLDTAALLGAGTNLGIGPANRTLIVRDRRGRRSGLPVDALVGVTSLRRDAFRGMPGRQGGGLVVRAGVAEYNGEVLTLIDLSPLQRETLDHF